MKMVMMEPKRDELFLERMTTRKDTKMVYLIQIVIIGERITIGSF